MTNTRIYFHQLHQQLRTLNQQSTESYMTAGQLCGIDRWKAFFRGSSLLQQANTIMQELTRIYRNRR